MFSYVIVENCFVMFSLNSKTVTNNYIFEQLNMNETKYENKLSELGCHIIRTLIYFDVFSYPLTSNEIFVYSQMENSSLVEVETELVILSKKSLVFEHNDFYALIDDEKLSIRRMKGNENAKKIIPKAHRNAKLIGSFPFVRGVGISGSLSKGYMDESGDVDFFIITEPEKLWIARTLLILYKKIFLLNSRKYFCVNYFIDTNHLEIPDKNIFTATEILTLIPAYNHEVFEEFLKANNWSRKYLPNKVTEKDIIEKKHEKFFKNIIEISLNNQLGNILDSFFMKLTLNKWKRKFKHIKETDFELALRSRKYVSKHHPQGFQHRVLSSIGKKIESFETINNLKLN